MKTRAPIPPNWDRCISVPTNSLWKRAADSRVNLQQVVVLGVGGEQVGDADHGAAERPPVLHAAQVLLLASAHPACGGVGGEQQASEQQASEQRRQEAPEKKKKRLPPILMMCTTM